MDHFKVLKRAWDVTWRYRALWIFGIILALTTASGGSSGGGGNTAGMGNGNGNGFPPGGFPKPEIPPQVVGILIALGLAFVGIMFLLIIVSTVARYIAETSLIYMVDNYEETGEKYTVGQGFRLGWSPTTWRLFLIDLITGLPIAILFGALFALSFTPLLLWITQDTTAGIIGTVAAIGLFFMTIFLAIIIGALLSFLRRFFWRACALENLGVMDALRQGTRMAITHLKDAGIMLLIMVGVQIAWGIAMLIFTLVLLVLAMLLGGLPAVITGGIVSLIFEGSFPWILGALVTIPVILSLVIIPGIFLNGIWEVFKSSTWTLTYRELRAMESLATNPQPVPEPEA